MVYWQTASKRQCLFRIGGDLDSNNLREKNNSDDFSLCSFSTVKCAVWWGFLRISEGQDKFTGRSQRIEKLFPQNWSWTDRSRLKHELPDPTHVNKNAIMRERWHSPLRKSVSTNLMIKTKKMVESCIKNKFQAIQAHRWSRSCSISEETGRSQISDQLRCCLRNQLLFKETEKYLML